MECPSCGMPLARGVTICSSCGEHVPSGLTASLAGGSKRTTALAVDEDVEVEIPPTAAIGADLFPEKSAALCGRCGMAVNPSAKFCASCGRPVTPTPLNKTLDATRSAANRGLSALASAASSAVKWLRQANVQWRLLLPFSLAILFGAIALVKYFVSVPALDTVSPIRRLNSLVEALVWLALSLIAALLGLLLKR